MTRVYNFSSGPGVLPLEVLERAKVEMLDWQAKGMSVMEMSHRGKEFISIAEKAEADLRDILSIPSHYHVLFLQGGASAQFNMIPMNLLQGKAAADYVITGSWSQKAHSEAKKYCTARVAATSKEQKFTVIPSRQSWDMSKDAAYIHYTPNETIEGVEFHWIPEVGNIPLVADMSSTLMSRPLDVSRFGLIYAGAQKNLGPAGLTIVIVRKDLVGHAMAQTPSVFDYKIQAENASMYNTPPTYSWYIAGLVFEWIKQRGGLEAMAKYNRAKAQKLYAVIDATDFYHNPVEISCRSWMNIPFTLIDSKLDDSFLAGAKAEGLVALKGHRTVGGMRASLYNAMPEEGVDALIDYMSEFERKHG